MPLSSLENNENPDSLIHPVSICFNQYDIDKWEELKVRLKKVNRKAKMSQFARTVMREMMVDVEKLIEAAEKEHL